MGNIKNYYQMTTVLELNLALDLLKNKVTN